MHEKYKPSPGKEAKVRKRQRTLLAHRLFPQNPGVKATAKITSSKIKSETPGP
jgi:hypothetical protein